MRRILIGVTLASVAVAAVVMLTRPDAPTAPTGPLTYEWGEIEWTEIELSEADREFWEKRWERLLDVGAIHIDPVTSPIDPQITAMDCRVVAEEELGGDRFLLTEECVWKGGRAERRQFEAFRRQDGPVHGWMYRPTESDT